MSLRYLVGINIVVVGDGVNGTLAFDLLKDGANVAGLGYKSGWLKGNLPSGVASVQGSADYDLGLSKSGRVLYITFPIAPPKGAQVPVDCNLLFDSAADDIEIETLREMGGIDPQGLDLDRWTGGTSGE